MPREYLWLDLDQILPAVPMMRRLGVSEVARSGEGFLSAYKRAGGDEELLGRHKSGQHWRDRRHNFVRRHMAQVKKRREPLWIDGEPSRRHLALVAWAYTPDRRRWEKWIQGGGASRSNPAPGYQSWSWTKQDWRTVRLRDGGVDYTLKCGEEGSRLPSGKARLCLPRFVIERLAKQRGGVDVIREQALKKQRAPDGARVPWHPRIKRLYRQLETRTPKDK